MSSSSVLSCLQCRSRKVKCDRVQPTCGRCNDARHPCEYRSRQLRPRKVKNSSANQSAATVDSVTTQTLALIWNRLEDIEKNVKNREATVLSDTSSLSTPIASSSALDATSSRSPTKPAQYPCTSLAQRGTPSTASRDIEASLRQAVDEARKAKNQNLAGSRAYLLEDVSIPPETAKAWVNNYFSGTGPRFWPALNDESLVDVKLLHLMPDLMQMKHVHIDACMQVIYYCVLWEGHLTFDENENRIIEPDQRLQRNLYFAGLRAVSTWQRQAAGSATDIMAATFMSRVALENFDIALSWDLHACACSWAEALELHNIDSIKAPGASSLATSDSGRMSMWKLVHIELLYRLIHTKDPAFSFDLAQWRVNFPFLFFDNEVDRQEAMPTTFFLAGSRVTLVLIRFFQVLQNDPCSGKRIAAVVSLCEEVEEAVREWDIFDWHQSYTRVRIDGWYLSELALSCYTSIVFMLRTVTQSRNEDEIISNSSSPDSQQAQSAKHLELHASRRVIMIINHMIQTIGSPGSLTLSIAFGFYTAHVAFANVVQHVRAGPKPLSESARDDLCELKKFTSSIGAVASKATEFLPFARALAYVETLNEEDGVRLVEPA